MRKYDGHMYMYYWWLECPYCHEHHNFFSHKPEPKTVSGWCDKKEDNVEVEL